MIWSLLAAVILSGISLSMDAFAVSICDGMVYKNLKKRKAVLMPLTFALFQTLMPIIGFYVGLACLEFIEPFDHWIAFALLVIIGGKMIFDSVKEIRSEEEEVVEKQFSMTEVLVQGVATSIDALAVGFSLNTMLSTTVNNVQLWAWLSVCIIGVITFVISGAGVIIGIKVGKMFKKKAGIAEIIGGAVLILIAVKIVLNSYGYLPF